MEFLYDNLSLNEKNHLTIGGVDVVDLKNKYGSPLYLMDEDVIRANIREYKNALYKYYDGNGMVLYASKAFSCKHIYRVAKEEGAGVDVVSGGELYTALMADFPPQKIYFHGNNKTTAELELAVCKNVGNIVIDNVYELQKLNEICEKENKIQNVLFRIKPGVDAHTHDFVKTGQIDSKFGFALETGEAIEVIESIKNYNNLKYVGIHCHIGSQIFLVDPFIETAEIMMNFIKEIYDKTGLKTQQLNLGGGFGIKYVSEDTPVKYELFIKAVSEVVKKKAFEHNIDVPFILMEPGRSLVAASGVTVYEVGSVKEIPNIRTYVSVDGGMADNPRYIMYQAQYSAILANKANEEPQIEYTIAGKCCESGDLLIENIKLPKVAVGDTLVVLSTGAYNYSMASNYNRIPKPPVVMVSNGNDKLVVKRETYEDVLKNDL